MKSVSAAIPSMGRIQYVDKSICSLLEQSLPFDEIVVFDNSREQNLRGLSQYACETRVRWERSGNHVGPAESWNAAVRLCRNDYVTLVGDDDLALPDFHHEIQEVLQRSNLGLLRFCIIDASGRRLAPNRRVAVPPSAEDLSPQEFRYARLRQQLHCFLPGWVFRKDRFFSVGGFVELGFPNGLAVDELLWLKLSCLEQRVAVGKTVCWCFRVHDGGGGRLRTMAGFSEYIKPYICEIRRALMQLNVSEEEVFPPELDSQTLVDRMQMSWFVGIARSALRQFRIADVAREVWLHLISDASLKGKAAGLWQLTWGSLLRGCGELYHFLAAGAGHAPAEPHPPHASTSATAERSISR